MDTLLDISGHVRNVKEEFQQLKKKYGIIYQFLDKFVKCGSILCETKAVNNFMFVIREIFVFS